MSKIGGYNFDLALDQQNIVSSIVEGRLVPRSLSDFETLGTGEGDACSYFYVDDNGIPKKVSLEYIVANGIEIVENEPEKANIGTIIFKEI